MIITIIKPKTGITMKMNSITKSDRYTKISIKSVIRNWRTLHPRPTRFNLHASPFFRSAVTQEFPIDTCNPFIPSKPNFQTPRLTVTFAMIRTYNETCPKKHKKSKPNPNPIRTQSKPNPNPIQTQFKPNPNPIVRNFFTALNSRAKV